MFNASSIFQCLSKEEPGQSCHFEQEEIACNFILTALNDPKSIIRYWLIHSTGGNRARLTWKNYVRGRLQDCSHDIEQ